MVRALHEAGIEVILDVVYNHTAEGNHLGPTLSMRGIDNDGYYRLVEDDQRYYMDYTGTGNSLNVRNPHTLQLIMDSLRYWVTEMHVDGFRFDLASTLAREFYDVDRLSTFFDLVQQDPVISQVKLIAEPWDVGPGGYQVGNFPPLWTEWNGKYRDTVRDFWRGEPATLGEFASRITGSSDLYQDDGRRPYASINFVTAHDGFTLQRPGVLQRQAQRGQRRGQPRRRDDNRSWNCGVEGPTDDAEVHDAAGAAAAQLARHAAAVPGRADAAARRRDGPHAAGQQQRLLPGQRAVLGGLVAGRAATPTWSTSPRAVIALRHSHPVFRRRRFFAGRPIRTRRASCRDIAWFTPAGEEMTEQDWDSGFGQSSWCSSTARASPTPTAAASGSRDDSFLLCFNAHDDDIEVTLPGRRATARSGRSWSTPPPARCSTSPAAASWSGRAGDRRRASRRAAA